MKTKKARYIADKLSKALRETPLPLTDKKRKEINAMLYTEWLHQNITF